MSRPAVFFDRDNTLIVGNEYLGDPAGVVLVRGAADAVAACHDLGFAVVTVSNQSGVARGMFSEHDVSLVNARMEEMLQSDNSKATIDRHEYCPHHPQGTTAGYAFDCDCRKPKPGMILRAAGAMDIDLAASWLVGDAPRDVAAGKTAGCRTILIVDPTLPASPAASAASDITADFVVTSLPEAVEIIQKESKPTAAQHEMPAAPALATEPTTRPVFETPKTGRQGNRSR
ncbi:MAG: HAD family hydrolase [Tepidisphaeraceae bacterium]